MFRNIFRLPFLGEQGKLPDDWNHIWTWQQYYTDCCKFAKTLIHLDVAAFKITNILGFNSVSKSFHLCKNSPALF